MLVFLKKRWVYHSLIWLSGYFALVALTWTEGEPDFSLWDCLTTPFIQYIPIIIFTYSSFWAKECFFDKRSYLAYAFMILLIAGGSLLLYELVELVDPNFGNSLTQNLVNIVFLLLLSTGLQYFKRGITNQYQLQELRAKTAETELNALKAQINPHFLFNTLNNIYATNNRDSAKGSEMILELSDVMRYHLEYSKIKLVRVEDEVQLLESYIKLEQLRLSRNCDVQFTVEMDDPRVMISPLLLIPFVENAFKHGTHPSKDSFVHMKLTCNSGELHFSCSNSIIKNRKVVKTEIGLENTVRRLELIYPKKHELKMDEERERYSVDLKISL